MKYLNSVKNILAIAFIVAVPILIFLLLQQGKAKETAINNLKIEQKEWTAKEGQLVTQVNSLEYSIKELKAVYAKDSVQYSKSQKELVKAKAKIKSLELKLKNVESYVSNDLTVTDTIIVKVKDSCSMQPIEPIKTLHLDLNLYSKDWAGITGKWPEIANNELLMVYTYKANITTIIDRKKTIYKTDGTKRLPIWRSIFPHYKYYGNSIVDDPNAEIENSIVIKFNK